MLLSDNRSGALSITAGAGRVQVYQIGHKQDSDNRCPLKKTNAVARREHFKTGGGPPERPETNDLGRLLTVFIDSQQPLEGIPDDDKYGHFKRGASPVLI